MIVTINQPAYLPWLGYFDRIAKADIHIILDHVQFEKNSVTNRNRVRTVTGWSWLTVPVSTKGLFGELSIDKIKINPMSKWAKKHLKTLQANYSRSAFYPCYAEYFENLYQKDWSNLAPLLHESTRYLCQKLGIQTQQLKSSELSPQSMKSDLILELCTKIGATTYLSGPFGRHYLDEGSFQNAGIKLQFHDYTHPIYKQTFDGFEPYMSIVDLLFNHGDKSLEILSS